MANKAWKVAIVTPLLSMLLLLSLSCGGDSEPIATRTATPTATPTPTSPSTLLTASVLADSAQGMLNLTSLAFTLKHEKGSTLLMAGIVMNEIAGKLDLPDSFSLSVKAEASLFKTFIEIEIISADGQVYMTDPISGEWQVISNAILPFDFTDLGVTLSNILISFQNPAAPVTRSLGRDTTLYIKGTVSSKDLADLIPAAADDLVVDLEVWVRVSDGLLVQARISGPVVSTDPPEVVRILTFEDFNQPVLVEPPI